ncbi:MAG TPA: hypothetical protein VLA29_06435 [Acidimicrobiia bacterium]|nr:hypothetical protein [Acidimicrobiia bacterium]
MTPNRWFAVTVATLVWAISLWFGFLAGSNERVTAFVIIAFGLVFASYALAGFSGADDPTGTGFLSSLIGLGTGIALIIGFQVTGTDTFAIATPVVAAGAAGAFGLEPTRDRTRIGARIAVVGLLTFLAVALYRVDPTVYGLVAPLTVFPAIAIADVYYDRVRAGVAGDGD